LRVDGLPLVVELLDRGGWTVTYGGFSRTTADRLTDAIAIATAANWFEPWIHELAKRVEAEVALHPEKDQRLGSRPHTAPAPRTEP
jgi:hypothetical protein